MENRYKVSKFNYRTLQWETLETVSAVCAKYAVIKAYNRQAKKIIVGALGLYPSRRPRKGLTIYEFNNSSYSAEFVGVQNIKEVA